MAEVTFAEADETEGPDALDAACLAVESFHAQIKEDPEADAAFKKLVTEHPLFQLARSPDQFTSTVSLSLNVTFMSADLYAVSGPTVGTCYTRPLPTAAEIAGIEKLLTEKPLVNVHLSEFETKNGSKLPAFFCCATKGEAVGQYDFVMVPDLPETPSAIFQLTVSQDSITAIYMSLENNIAVRKEMQSVPSGIMALTRGAMVALDTISQT